MASSRYEPDRRFYPYSAVVDDMLCLGGGKSKATNSLQVYNCRTESWKQHLTDGSLPPGLYASAFSHSKHNLYLYGGVKSDGSYSGCLHILDTITSKWTELSKQQPTSPMKKWGCGMVVHQNYLVLVGGFGLRNGPIQPGSKWMKGNAADNDDDPNTVGWTNEIHKFNLCEGTWDSAVCSGNKPPPCSFFSLTMIDHHRAVLFGGKQARNRSNNSYILDLAKMSWSKIRHTEKGSSPGKRSRHAAVCLDFNGNRPQLLITGGVGEHDSLLNDLWMLDITSLKWKEIKVYNFQPREALCAAALPLGPEVTEVVLFGGSKVYPPADDSHFLADTTVLRFVHQGISSSSIESWVLTDIADFSQLGSPRRLEEKRRLMESSKTLDETIKSLQQQVAEMKLRTQKYAIRIKESDRRTKESDRRTKESDRRAEESDRRALKMQENLQEKAREMAVAEERQIKSQQDMEQQLRQYEQFLQERTREVNLARQQLRECEQRLAVCYSYWVVRRDEIEMTGPELGRGGWATVNVATFRGVQVAAKTIHNQIISPHNIQLFRREMNMAARLRHPNLVQFIGATLEGSMVILTELMPTSLRAQFQIDLYLQPRLVKNISMDVARALNYLHQMRPDPIIHRDIGSGNVLLEPLPGMQFRAKLADYGTVNLVCQLETVNPGSPVYAAPEANDPRLQSPKMDIYSFGALMLEMLTGRLPVPEDRPSLLLKVNHEEFLDLIHRCLSEKKEDRPDAAAIIKFLG